MVQEQTHIRMSICNNVAQGCPNHGEHRDRSVYRPSEMTGSSRARKELSDDSVKFSVCQTGQMLSSPCWDVHVTVVTSPGWHHCIRCLVQLVSTTMAGHTAGEWNEEEVGAGSTSVDTDWFGHGRSCPGSRGLSPVPTILTGPGNGHCDSGDASHRNARQQCTYVDQGFETFSARSAWLTADSCGFSGHPHRGFVWWGPLCTSVGCLTSPR